MFLVVDQKTQVITLIVVSSHLEILIVICNFCIRELCYREIEGNLFMLYSNTGCCDGPFFTGLGQNPGLTRVDVRKNTMCT